MKEILLKQFNSLAEAELNKNLLLKYGIKSLVQKKGLEWSEGAGGDIAGAILYVLEKDVRKAKEILDEIKFNPE